MKRNLRKEREILIAFNKLGFKNVKGSNRHRALLRHGKGK